MPRGRWIPAAFRARVRAWALRRQGVDVLPKKLAARRVYILPTPAGWTFGLLLGVMFIAGMNYGNGLALLFTFWLTGFALVAMVQTQRSLAGLQLLDAVASPAHAGDVVRLRLRLTGRSAPQDLQLRFDDSGLDGDSGKGVAPARDAGRAHRGENADGITAEILATRRGRWRAPALHLGTTAPFGLFRTWTWLRIDAHTLVYPAASGARPVPDTPGEGSGGIQLAHGLDELAWLRDFRDGDSPRQVAWKAYARGQPLLVREYHGDGALRREFDFDVLGGLGLEERLSQLAKWIVDAQSRGESWVLKLPGTPPLAGAGRAHREDCLSRLALYDSAGPGA